MAGNLATIWANGGVTVELERQLSIMASAGELFAVRLRQATPRSGTDPDDRDRNRQAQTKCAERSQGELGEQICLGSYIR